MKLKTKRTDYGYSITTETGDVHRCERSGEKFIWRKPSGESAGPITVKQIKQAIEAKAKHVETCDEAIAERDARDLSATWDHVDPCALLALQIHNRGGSSEISAFCEETLDAHGYMTPDGRVDIETARREVNRRKRATAEAMNRPEPAKTETSGSGQTAYPWGNPGSRSGVGNVYK